MVRERTVTAVTLWIPASAILFPPAHVGLIDDPTFDPELGDAQALAHHVTPRTTLCIRHGCEV
jgi:hypothetical protein